MSAFDAVVDKMYPDQAQSLKKHVRSISVEEVLDHFIDKPSVNALKCALDAAAHPLGDCKTETDPVSLDEIGEDGHCFWDTLQQRNPC